ncbi:ferritin-like domain-containing protein [Nocardioides ferulae]|uniref:ferritin-like domain-containing protein n=1 Tax=Nocardioides ferulae TaxID=2340821 RepID=UPI000EB0ECA2|nr:ferritin-like domain-containing protein [Nocardioides ferulae]
MTARAALQTALAAEHAAVYVYGVLGARTSRSAQPELHADLTAAYVAHRGERDRLVRAIRDLGAAPAAAEPAYQVPEPLDGPAVVRGVAAQLESDCSSTWGWVVAGTEDALRAEAVSALIRAAVRELVFRGTPEMFPGADEHADR